MFTKITGVIHHFKSTAHNEEVGTSK